VLFFGALSLIANRRRTWSQSWFSVSRPDKFPVNGSSRCIHAGRCKKFDLPLKPVGTPFQRRVWARLSVIPHGRVETHGVMVKALRSGPRAVKAPA